MTAETIINVWPPQAIEQILKEYGEERFTKNIVKNIIEQRKKESIKTTQQLAKIIKQAVPAKFQQRRIHPATKTFQALRIAVNNELENIKKALPQALEVLEKGGRLIVISFHSLEDRIVKNFFKEQALAGLLQVLTKKPIIAQLAEVKENPRARSAKLRASIKL